MIYIFVGRGAKVVSQFLLPYRKRLSGMCAKGEGVLVVKTVQNSLHITDEQKLPPSQMTGFNAYFSLLKVKIDIPYQKVIVYVNHFGLYKKKLYL